MQITKRDMLAAAGAAAAAVALTRTALGGWEPSERYPDPAVADARPELRDDIASFSATRRAASPPARRWNEGPVYFGDGRYLLWSDIPNNRILRWDEETGRVSVFRKPSNFANGNTRDRQGRLVTCEHDTRRVTRTEYDGTITVLVDRFDGKPLNSPNDVVVKSDNSIWFTDPPFGILGNYEGHVATAGAADQRLPRSTRPGGPRSPPSDVKRPNGLAFSPDEKKLYVVEAALGPRVIQVFDVVDGGTKLANERPFIDAEPGGTPDGFRVDVDGNLWCGWGMGNAQLDGVKIFDPDGQADRLHRAARALRQRLLRRRQAQPPVHGGEPLGLFALREHPGRAGRLMAETLPGILAIFNNVAPGREAEFEEWFQHEHLAERIAVPGFLLGRRYEAVSGAAAIFQFLSHAIGRCAEIGRLSRAARPSDADDAQDHVRDFQGHDPHGLPPDASGSARCGARRRSRCGLPSRFGPRRAQGRAREAGAGQGRGLRRNLVGGRAPANFRCPKKSGCAAATARSRRASIVETLRVADAEKIAQGAVGANFRRRPVGVYRLLCEIRPA